MDQDLCGLYVRIRLICIIVISMLVGHVPTTYSFEFRGIKSGMTKDQARKHLQLPYDLEGLFIGTVSKDSKKIQVGEGREALFKTFFV